MPETPACYRPSRCLAEGARPCPGCAARPRATTRASQRMSLAEDAVMAMATSITVATIFIALAFWLA